MSAENKREFLETTDENGNTVNLEILRYFFYNGDEFAAICEADGADDEVFFMKVTTPEDAEDEDEIELTPVIEDLENVLLEIFNNHYAAEYD